MLELRLTPCVPWELRLTPCVPWELRLTPCVPWELRLTPCVPWELRLTLCVPWELRLTLCVTSAPLVGLERGRLLQLLPSVEQLAAVEEARGEGSERRAHRADVRRRVLQRERRGRRRRRGKWGGRVRGRGFGHGSAQRQEALRPAQLWYSGCMFQHSIVRLHAGRLHLRSSPPGARQTQTSGLQSHLTRVALRRPISTQTVKATAWL